MMETREIITQNNQQSDRITLSAEHDFRVLSDAPVNGVFQSLDSSSTGLNPSANADQYSQYDSELGQQISSLWDQLNYLFSNGLLEKDHAVLVEFALLLQKAGILPADGDINEQSLLHFHQWFIHQSSDLFSHELTKIEGMILYQWSQNQTEAPLDQVIVFDALNMFQQYSIYTQVIIDDHVFTLSYYDSSLVSYNGKDHTAFGILFNHEWVEPSDSTIDYQQAHTYLNLTENDRFKLNEWLAGLFPAGYDGLTDDAILTSLINYFFQPNSLAYESDFLDQWDSIADFLDKGAGDCEEFSHLFYSAVHHIFSGIPDRPAPSLTVVAGLVGTGINQFGHSVIQLDFDGKSYILDLTGSQSIVRSIKELPTYDAYQQSMNLEEVLRYTAQETHVFTESLALNNFSTATNYDYDAQLETQFQAVFGSNASFDSISSLEDNDYTISTYNDLIQKVIGMEMLQLVETGQTGFMNSILLSDLSQFELNFGLGSSSGFLDYQSEVNQLMYEKIAAGFTGQISTADLDFVSEDQRQSLFNELIDLGYVVQVGSDYMVSYAPRNAISRDAIWTKLYQLGYIDEYGMVLLDAIENQALKTELALFFESYGIYGDISNDVVDLLQERSYIFSDAESRNYGDDPFENTLIRFESLSEEIFSSLTAPTTPIYSSHPSDYVIGGYDSNSDSNSMFVRIDHQKMQEAMSLFFSLQNTISAYLTVFFSISDMVSSVAAKLGEDNSVASSTARQRQKIIQSFNSYTSGLNESLNSLMDFFEKSIEKNNEARYQTAIAQTDFEYSDVWSQLGNTFLANQFEIKKEGLKAQVSQDYYRNQFNNRKSMQKAMLDVPNFGPNLMPSGFSNLFIDTDYGDMSSMQVWAALFANGVIDETGTLIDGIDLDNHALLNRISDDETSAFKNFDVDVAPDTDSAIRMKLLLNEQNALFIDSWGGLTSDQKTTLLGNVRTRLTRHRDSLSAFSMIDINKFDTSQYLFSYMDMFERAGDDAYSLDMIFTGDLTEIGDNFLEYSLNIDQYNNYGDGTITESSLQQFRFDRSIKYYIHSFSDFYSYQSQIDTLLKEKVSAGFDGAISVNDFTFVPSDERQALLDELINLGYIKTIGSEYFATYQPSQVRHTFNLPVSSAFYDNIDHINEVLFDRIEAGFDGQITPGHFSQIASESQQTLFDELVLYGYIVPIGSEYFVSYPDTISEFNITESDIWAVLKSNDLIDANGKINQSTDFFLGTPIKALQDLFPSNAGEYQAELIYNFLYINSKSNAMHLTESAAISSESGSGFQIANFDLISMARKNLMMMNMTKRIYLSVISSYNLFFEKIASKLSRDATSSSHYGDLQSSLMESHLGLVDRQLSSIQSDTVSMVDRINDLHRHRLNIIKMGDPVLRTLDLASDWSGIAGALLMLAPTPVTQLMGVLLSMASSILSLGESWRGEQMEQHLDQQIDISPIGIDGSTGFKDIYSGLNAFFATNLDVSNDEYTTSTDGTIQTDVMPRAVVDYTNAHQYINPDSDQVQQLLNSAIFPNGVPIDPAQIVEGVHAYMNDYATYVPDYGQDHWATVDETATSLQGDCEDLVNLEYSLILAAFNQHELDPTMLKAHAAYVDTISGRQGHVFLTYADGFSDPVVLDPSLNSDGSIPTYTQYCTQYNVEDVFTYTNDSTNVMNREALGLETASFFSDVWDEVTGLFDGLIFEDLMEMFIPDFSNPSIFDGLFNVNSGDSSDESTARFVGDAIGLMFDNFIENASGDNWFTKNILGTTAQGFRNILEPMVMSFTPGNTGYDISSSSLSFVEDVISLTFGDSFNADTAFIRNLLLNRGQGLSHALGFDDSSSSAAFESILSIMGIKIADIYEEKRTDYTFVLNSDSSFLLYQQDIETLLFEKMELGFDGQLTLADFDFLPDGLRQSLLDELISLGYLKKIGSVYFVSYPGVDDVSDDAESEDDGSSSSNNGVIYTFNLDDDSQYNHHLQEINDVLFNKIELGFSGHITANDFSFVSVGSSSDLFSELIQLGFVVPIGNQYFVSYPSYSSSAGAAYTLPLSPQLDPSTQARFSSAASSDTTSSSLQFDYKNLLSSLLDDQQTLLQDGFFLQTRSINYGSDLDNIMFGTDSTGYRVMLNQYNVGAYKDTLRQVQEKLRSLFLLVKMVSDAIATIAANLGDENKIKVAAGLQKLFESNFEFLTIYFDAQEQLLSHYQSSQNHNVKVTKTRHERIVDASLKSGAIGFSLRFAQFGQLIYSALDILQTIGLYEDFANLNPYSDKYLLDDFFDDSGYLQSIANNRYNIAEDDQTDANSMSEENNFEFSGMQLSTMAIATYRSNACDILKEAAATPPIESGGQLTLPWLDHAKTMVLDQDKFSEYRLRLINLGIQQQKWMMIYIAITSYLSSIAKSLRGDSKVGSQHLTAAIDIIEREVSHDLEELGRIQNMQETAISLNNQQYGSMKKVEKSYYEAIFFVGYFATKGAFSSSFPAIELLTVKAFANMFQGILLSYWNWNKGSDLNRVDDELDDHRYDSSDRDDVEGIGYSGSEESSTINYSGVYNQEDNYLAFSNSRNQLIYDKQYQNKTGMEYFGMSFQSVNWFEYAKQSMMLKKLFTQWDLMLKSGQNIAQAYQNIADELGAVTSSFGYTQALKSQMKLKKGVMSKNVLAVFDLASDDVGRFNELQEERFETFLQSVKYGFLKGLDAYGKRLEASKNRLGNNKTGFNKSIASFYDNSLNFLIEFSEKSIKAIVGGIRSEELQKMKARLRYDQDFEYGSSFSEALLYGANFAKAKQKITGDIVGKIKSYQANISAMFKDLINKWTSKAKEIGRGFSSPDGTFLNDQKHNLAKGIFAGDSEKVKAKMREVSAFLSNPESRSAGGYVANFGASFATLFLKYSGQQGLSKSGLAEDQLLANSGVKDSLDRLQKLVQKTFKGQQDVLDKFITQRTELETLIKDLRTQSTLDSTDTKKGASDTAIGEQLKLLQSISKGFKTLQAYSNEISSIDQVSDGFKGLKRAGNLVKRVIWKQSSFRETNLDTIANNIDAFTLNGNISYILKANQTKDLDTIKQKQLSDMMMWIEEMAKQDTKKVYQNVGDVMIYLSLHHKDVFKNFLDNAFDEKDLGDDPDKITYKKQLYELAAKSIAAQEHRFKDVLQLLTRNGTDNNRAIEILTGEKGILTFARQMDNGIGIKRLLHAINYFSLSNKVGRISDETSQSLLSDWLLTKNANLELVDHLVATDSIDGKETSPATLYRFSDTPFYRNTLGWYRHDDVRLKKIVDASIEKIKQEPEGNKQDAYIELLRFAAKLNDRHNNNEKFTKIIQSIVDHSLFNNVFKNKQDFYQRFDQLQNTMGGMELLSLLPKDIRYELPKNVADLRSKYDIRQLNQQSSNLTNTDLKHYENPEKIQQNQVELALHWKYLQDPNDVQWFKEMFRRFPNTVLEFSKRLILDKEDYMKFLETSNFNSLTLTNLPDESQLPFDLSHSFSQGIRAEIINRLQQPNASGSISIEEVRDIIKTPIDLIVNDREFLQEILAQPATNETMTLLSQVVIASQSNLAHLIDYLDVSQINWNELVLLNSFNNINNKQCLAQKIRDYIDRYPSHPLTKKMLSILPQDFLNTLFSKGLLENDMDLNDAIELVPPVDNPELIMTLFKTQPDFLLPLILKKEVADDEDSLNYLIRFLENNPSFDHQFFRQLNASLRSTPFNDFSSQLFDAMNQGQFSDQWLSQVIEDKDSYLVEQLMFESKRVQNDDIRNHLLDKINALAHRKMDEGKMSEFASFYESAIFSYFGVSLQMLKNMLPSELIELRKNEKCHMIYLLIKEHGFSPSPIMNEYFNFDTVDLFYQNFDHDFHPAINDEKSSQDIQIKDLVLTKKQSLLIERNEFFVSQQSPSFIQNNFSNHDSKTSEMYQNQINNLQRQLTELNTYYSLDEKWVDYFARQFGHDQISSDVLDDYKRRINDLYNQWKDLETPNNIRPLLFIELKQLTALAINFKGGKTVIGKDSEIINKSIIDLLNHQSSQIDQSILNLISQFDPMTSMLIDQYDHHNELFRHRIKDLQSKLFVRPNGMDYVPVSDIMGYLNRFDEPTRKLYINELMRIIPELISDANFVSVERTLDIVFEIFNHDHQMLFDNSQNDFREVVSNWRSFFQTIINQDHLRLSDNQKFKLIEVMHFMDRKVSNQSNDDVSDDAESENELFTAANIHQLENIVGIGITSQYLSSLRTPFADNFIKKLQQRVFLSNNNLFEDHPDFKDDKSNMGFFKLNKYFGSINNDNNLLSLSDQDRADFIQSFVEEDLIDLLKYPTDFQRLCTRFVRNGLTKDIVKAVAKKINNAENLCDSNVNALQKLIMQLNNNFNASSEHASELVFSMFFKEVDSIFKAGPTIGSKPDKMFDFLFRAVSYDHDRQNVLSDFQKKFAAEFKNAFFESKKDLFDYHWLNKLTSMRAKQKFDHYFSKLLSTRDSKEKKYCKIAFIEHLFYDKGNFGHNLTPEQKERYFQRLIDRIMNHQITLNSRKDILDPLMERLDSSKNNSSDLFFAQVAHYFKHKSFLKRVSHLGGIMSTTSSYSPLNRSLGSNNKAQTLNSLIELITSKIDEDQYINENIQVYDEDQHNLEMKQTVDKRRHNNYVCLAAHLFVSSDQFAESKKDQIAIAKQILSSINHLKNAKEGESMYAADIDQFFNYVNQLASPQQLVETNDQSVLMTAIRQTFKSNSNRLKSIENIVSDGKNKRNKYRHDLVQLSKRKLVSDQNFLYKYEGILRKWEQYNRNYENGSRTEKMGVGSSPGSLKID